MGFVSLHNHSDHSLRDGFQSVETMLSYASALGQSAIALTDHGTMSGCGEGFRYADKYGIKFIPGCEHYLCNDVTIKDKDTKHIILLATNKTGYRNLNILTTKAHSKDCYYFKPRLDLDLLEKYSDGLICTTACIAGCQSRIKELKDIFGDRLYIELHTNTMPEQHKANIEWLELADKYDVQFYAATDSHYTLPTQATYQEMWQVGDYQLPPDFYMYSEDEVRKALSYLGNDVVNLSIANTQVVADRCTFKMKYGDNHYPRSPYSDPKQEIKRRVWAGMKEKNLQQDNRHIEQVKHELDILEKVDYFDYFLIVSDMLNHCKHNDIRTGVGRGSVVGCDVAYLMGITKIDPIENGLIFERFAHTERVTPPDIDTDVPRGKRQDVIQYLKDTYGHVYQVATFNKMAEKAAIRRACEAFNLEPVITNKVCKIFESLDDLDKCDMLSVALLRRLNLFTLPNEFDFFKKTVHQFLGKLQNYGTHASAVVVMTTDPYDFCAVERFSEQYNLNYDYHDLEAMGLLKLDILGLETLDIMDSVLYTIKYKDKIDDLVCNDQEVYRLLWEGKTAGVFQLEGSTVKDVCSKVRPTNLSELTAVVALGRPGAMAAGATSNYIARKAMGAIGGTIGSQPQDGSLGRRIDTLFSDTFGCMIYQEQVMKLVQECWGVSMGEADMVRRAIGRKDKDVMDKVIKDLSSKENKWHMTPEETELLLDHISEASGYLFNKSHSAAYAYTAYQTAYLKRYHPCEFYTALLNANIDQDKALEYIGEYTQEIGNYKLVSITDSESEWTTDGKSIRMGFSYIKGVGNANFKKPSRDDELGLEEFLNLNPSLNKQVCINLVKAGAFAVDPQWGIDYVEWFKKAYKREQECKEKIALYEANGKENLKKSWEGKLVQIPSAPDFSSYSTETSVARMMQREVLSLSTIPFWVDYDKSLCSRNVKMVEVQKFSKFQTKKGDMMYKIIGMDTNLTISEFLFYSPEPLIERHLGEIKVNDVVLIQTGRNSSNGSVWCRDIIKAKKVA